MPIDTISQSAQSNNTPQTALNGPTTVSPTQTPQTGIESPAESNVDGLTTTPGTDPSPPLNQESERTARSLAKASRESRAAKEQARKAAQERAAAIQDAEAARKTATELQDLINGAGKDRSAALALLQKAGIRNEDDLARILIGIDPQKPSAEEKLEALEKRLADREAAETKAREEAIKAQREAYFQQTHQRYLSMVQEQLGQNPKDYELVIATEGFPAVLDRAYKYCAAEKVNPTPEQEKTIIKYFADELEESLTLQATNAYRNMQGLEKIKALSIPTHNLQRTNEEPTNPAIAQAVAKARERRVSKFITNESTISSQPLPKEIGSNTRR